MKRQWWKGHRFGKAMLKSPLSCKFSPDIVEFETRLAYSIVPHEALAALLMLQVMGRQHLLASLRPFLRLIRLSVHQNGSHCFVHK